LIWRFLGTERESKREQGKRERERERERDRERGRERERETETERERKREREEGKRKNLALRTKKWVVNNKQAEFSPSISLSFPVTFVSREISMYIHICIPSPIKNEKLGRCMKKNRRKVS